MTPDTAKFLLDLLNQQQLSVGSPGFDGALEQVLKARQQLREIIGGTDDGNS